MTTTKRVANLTVGDIIIEEREGLDLMTGRFYAMPPARKEIVKIETEADNPAEFAQHRRMWPDTAATHRVTTRMKPDAKERYWRSLMLAGDKTLTVA